MFTKFLKPSHRFIFNTHAKACINHAIETERNDRIKRNIILFFGIIAIGSIMSPSWLRLLNNEMQINPDGFNYNQSVNQKDSICIPPTKELILKSQCYSPIWLKETLKEEPKQVGNIKKNSINYKVKKVELSKQ